MQKLTSCDDSASQGKKQEAYEGEILKSSADNHNQCNRAQQGNKKIHSYACVYHSLASQECQAYSSLSTGGEDFVASSIQANLKYLNRVFPHTLQSALESIHAADIALKKL